MDGVPVVREHNAHVDRRRQFARGLPAVIALALALAAGSRLLMDGGGANQPGATTTTATTAPGSTTVGRAQVSLDASANLRATIDIDWSSSPETLSLSVPAETPYGLRPRVAISHIEADGLVDKHTFNFFPVPRQVTLAPGQRADIPLVAGVNRTRLEYTVTGTHVISTPSAPGRGLVLLTPLQVADGDVRLRLEVTDDRILNLACRTAEQTEACGTRDGDTWTVEVLAAGEYVIAQVDLAAG